MPSGSKWAHSHRMPFVINRHHHKDGLPSGAIYIGRGTPLGNPFTVQEHGEDALGLYRRWLSEGWEEKQRAGRQLFPLDADRTLVIWTKGIRVGVELRWDDSCDPGSSFIFPAL